jgi:hypothetical protein
MRIYHGAIRQLKRPVSAPKPRVEGSKLATQYSRFLRSPQEIRFAKSPFLRKKKSESRRSPVFWQKSESRRSPIFKYMGAWEKVIPVRIFEPILSWNHAYSSKLKIFHIWKFLHSQGSITRREVSHWPFCRRPVPLVSNWVRSQIGKELITK